MRTESDLFHALAQREELAPEVDPVLAGARVAAVRHRRRRAVTTASALTLAAVVAGVTTLPTALGLGADEPGTQPPPGERVVIQDRFDTAPFAFTVAAGVVEGFEIRPYLASPDYQVAEIWQPGESDYVGHLVVYRPGAGDGFAPRGGGPDLLQWEYAPDSYAGIQFRADTAPDPVTLQQIADGVQFTPPRPVRLPYQLDYLPAGLTLSQVSQRVDDTVPFEDRYVHLLLERDNRNHPLLNIIAAPTRDAILDPHDELRSTDLGGRPAQCIVDVSNGLPCLVDLGGFTISITSTGMEPAELDRLVAGITPAASWDDPATWYEIDDALPAT